MDATIVSSILGTVGPLGALVIAVVWVLTRRQTNGRSDHYHVLLTKMDGLREDIGEIKSDVRELRSGLVHHLEDHANA